MNIRLNDKQKEKISDLLFDLSKILFGSIAIGGFFSGLTTQIVLFVLSFISAILLIIVALYLIRKER